MSKKKHLLRDLAHARSGDKGSDANIGVIAHSAEAYDLIKKNLTSEVVQNFFHALNCKEVIRYELHNLNALNFVLKGALGTGGSTSLRSDAQGKALGEALLHLTFNIGETK